MTELLSASIVLPFVLVVLLVGSVVIWFVVKQNRQLKSNLLTVEQTLEQTLEKLEQVDDAIHEMRTGNHALSKKVKELMVITANLNDKQQQLAEQDPQSRFYQKGAQLIAAGATLEQVMLECDLPRAEAELLFSLHQP